MKAKILKRFEDEVAALERELKMELPKEIQRARELGDLRENAEYQAAKERQTYIQARIGMLRRRSNTGVHPRMAAITGVFQIAWIYYGLLIVSRPVVMWNLVAVIINLFSVAAYLYFKRRERLPVGP